MKLQTAEIKKFRTVSDTIKTRSILPILSYLKFDNGTITKSNMESFVTMEVDFEGSFLVDEKILMSFVESVKGKEIDVEVTEKSVILTCNGKRYTSPTDDVKNFPPIADAEGGEVELYEEEIEQIKIASAFTMERENLPYTSCVFLGNGIIGAVSGFTAYVDKISEKIPKITLEKPAADAVKKFKNVTFSENETYQFFSNGIYRFGFAKRVINHVDLKPFSVVPAGIEKIEVDKAEIISFCDVSVDSCQNRFVIAQFDGKKLIMNDPAYENDYEVELPVEFPSFKFNPSFFGKMLKSLPEEKLFLSFAQGKCYVTGKDTYVSLIMELVVNPSK